MIKILWLFLVCFVVIAVDVIIEPYAGLVDEITVYDLNEPDVDPCYYYNF